MDNPRELALKSLIKTDTLSVFSNLEINTTLQRATLSEADRGLYTALYLGVLEKKLTLDYIIKKYSSTPLEKIEVTEINLLRLGIYQLYFMDKIPDYSAVDECVSLAPRKTKGFINAILRAFIRDDKKVDFPKEKWERVSIMQSYPMELIELLVDSYGEELTYKLLNAEAKDHDLSLRVNTLKISVDEAFKKIKALDENAIKSSFADDIIKSSVSINQIKDLIDNGLVFIQDEASRICSIAVGARENEKILDACACPGGKSFSMSIDMKNSGQLLSCDLHENKLSLITKGAKRLGIDIITVKEQNGKTKNSELINSFDRVLCDVPCSGLGVILKKPDIKYKDIESIKGLPSVQFDILSNCSKYVKNGGILVYSTCTINKKENEDNVNKFLKENNSFVLDTFTMGNTKIDGMHTFFPHIEKTDGFFIAKMKRVK